MTASSMRLAMALALTAAGGIAGSGGVASADDATHHVKYTVTATRSTSADIYYRDTDPANFAEYSHNPYLFSPKTEAEIGPNQPWVLDVTLTDPKNWAMVVATSGWSSSTPGLQCQLEVDGVVLATNQGPKGALCSIRSW